MKLCCCKHIVEFKIHLKNLSHFPLTPQMASKINQRHDCLVAIYNNCFDTIAGEFVCSVANVFSSLMHSKYYLFFSIYDVLRYLGCLSAMIIRDCIRFFPRNIYSKILCKGITVKLILITQYVIIITDTQN